MTKFTKEQKNSCNKNTLGQNSVHFKTSTAGKLFICSIQRPNQSLPSNNGPRKDNPALENKLNIHSWRKFNFHKQQRYLIRSSFPHGINLLFKTKVSIQRPRSRNGWPWIIGGPHNCGFFVYFESWRWGDRGQIHDCQGYFTSKEFVFENFSSIFHMFWVFFI